MTPTRATRGLSRPLLLATVAMGGILAPLNSTMLAVALPELRGDFALSRGAVGWLVSAYLIAMAVAQPLGGRLGDQLGRAFTFRLGLVAFLGFSLAAALSPSFLVLLLLRTGQALFGAAVIPNGLAMLRESLPRQRLGGSMGLIGTAISFAAAVGPLLGTGLLAVGSWRLLFLVNLPLVLAGLVCARSLKYPEHRERGRLALDWSGALVFGAILAATTLVLSSFLGTANRVALTVGALSLPPLVAVFVRSQRASAVPVVEWRLFRRPSFAGSTSYVLFSNLIMYTTLVSVPFLVEEVQKKGSGASGTLLGAMSVLVALSAPVGGRLSDRLGRRTPALVGSLVVVVASSMLLIGVARDVSYAYLAVSLALLGFGIGAGFGPASAAAAESVPADEAGAATGTNSMMRYVGSIIGVAILSAVLGGHAAAAPDAAPFRAVFAVLVVVSLLATVSTLFIQGRRPSAAESPSESGLTASPLSSTGGHR
jgi:EmrB/QacA subfamily drug resistance transporter